MLSRYSMIVMAFIIYKGGVFRYEYRGIYLYGTCLYSVRRLVEMPTKFPMHQQNSKG